MKQKLKEDYCLVPFSLKEVFCFFFIFTSSEPMIKNTFPLMIIMQHNPSAILGIILAILCIDFYYLLKTFLIDYFCLFCKYNAVTPRLTVTPSRVTANAGQPFQLRCQPSGQGPFNIEWTKLDGQLSPQARESNGVLEIRQSTRADAGRYRCVATNVAGSSEGFADVVIIGEFSGINDS